MDSTPPTQLSPLESGLPVSVRGQSWTILDVERGRDCHAIKLQADDPAAEHSRTLLDPFDRFRTLVDRQGSRWLPIEKWLAVVRRHASEMWPPGGLIAPARTRVQLHAWQLEPALAMLRHGATRVLVADGVGLGKTVQAGLIIAELCARSQSTRVLVLVPAGLRQQWSRELERQFTLSTCNADASWLASTSRDRHTDWNPWSLPGVYLSSHDFAKRPEVLRPLEEVTWDLVVLDEAHAASLHTDRRAAADAIARRSRRVVLLTATPHPDSPPEFEALCRIGAIGGDEPPILLFRRGRQDVAPGFRRRSKLLLVRPSAAERRMHELLDAYTKRIWLESSARGDDLARLLSVILRKRALSSAGSLLTSIRRRMDMLIDPPRTEQHQLQLPLADEDPVEDEESVAALGAPGLADARRERRWLASIAEAAHHASRAETKLHYVVRLLRRIGEPAILFTEYRDTLARLERGCTVRGIRTITLHGGMAPAERARVQRTFNESALTLLATDAASEGLNLHARCRLVIHYELPWTASRLEQRAGRVDRLGQTRRVHEIGLVAGDTAEALVIAPLAARAARARLAGTLSDGLSSTLSESRVAALVINAPPSADHQTGDPKPRASGSEYASSDPVQLPANAAERPRGSLSADAVEEVRRLSQVRAFIKSSRTFSFGRYHRSITSVRQRTSALAAGLYAAYRVTLRTKEGRVAAVLPCVLHARLPAADSRGLNRTGLRAIARRLETACDSDVRDAVKAVVLKAVDETAQYRATTAAAAARREQAMTRNRPQAAQELVQAGLFDRRALRAASLQRRAERLLHDESDFRITSLGSGSVLGIDVHLIAVLHVACGNDPQ